MIIPYALQQFLFCGSEVHDRDRGAVYPGDRNSSRHAVCHGAYGIDDGCTKGPARGYGRELLVPGPISILLALPLGIIVGNISGRSL